MITTRQIKAARLYLGWEQRDLAEKSGLSLPTIQRMEKLGMGKSSVANAEKVVKALQDAGIIFIEAGAYSGEGGEGVRLASGRNYIETGE